MEGNSATLRLTTNSSFMSQTVEMLLSSWMSIDLIVYPNINGFL